LREGRQAKGAAAMGGGDERGVDFRYANRKLIWYVLGSFAFVAACAWILYLGLAPHGSFKEVVIWFGIPFFGLCGVMALRNMRDTRAVLTISPEGIRDHRISEDLIPWCAIRGMRLQQVQKQNFVMLDLDSEEEKKLRLTRLASWTKPMNAAIGFHGLCVNPAGLDGSLDEILAALERFAPSDQGGAA
jgi:hypothetical protein